MAIKIEKEISILERETLNSLWFLRAENGAAIEFANC